MRNIIEYALIKSGGQAIAPNHLPFIHASSGSPTDEATLDNEVTLLSVPLNLEQAESMLIDYALSQSEDNIAVAARMLRTSRPKLYRYLMKKGR